MQDKQDINHEIINKLREFCMNTGNCPNVIYLGECEKCELMQLVALISDSPVFNITEINGIPIIKVHEYNHIGIGIK